MSQFAALHFIIQIVEGFVEMELPRISTVGDLRILGESGCGDGF